MDSLAALILLAAHVRGGVAARYSAKYSATHPPAPADLDPTGALAVEVLTTLDDRHEDSLWPRRVVRCARTLGFSRCLKAFAVCRGERAAEAASRGEGLIFHLRDELEEQFPWEHFSNTTEEQLDARLLVHAVGIFHGRDVTLSYPGGLSLDVHSRSNGSLQLDFKKDTSDVSARGRGSRWRRTFYRIVPFMLIPPLIMAAILPFKLPAFMMLSMGAVMINNMAFTGSLFTLLRNNAFDDSYEKKVIYVNEGYKNEEALSEPVHETTFSEGAFPEESFNHAGFPNEVFSNGGFSGGGFSVTSFPEVYSSNGFQDEIVHGELYENSGKVKKRRGHKYKRRRRRPGKRRPLGSEEEWEGQATGSFPVGKLSISTVAEGGAGQFPHSLIQDEDSFTHGTGGVEGDGGASEEDVFSDYSDFKKLFKSKTEK